MKSFVFTLLISLPLLTAASGDDVRWRPVPYADLYDAFMSAFIDGKYIRTTPAFEVRGRNFSIHDLRIEIDAEQGVIVVNVEEDGLTDFPLESALAAENPDVRTNAPRGGLGAAIRYSAEMEPVQEFNYGLLEEMRSEYRAAVGSLGVMARLSLPRPIGLLIKFETPEAHARILTDQPVKLEADAQGYLLIPRKQDWRERNPIIELSETPRKIILGLDGGSH